MTRYTIRSNKDNSVRNDQSFANYYTACDELQVRIGRGWEREWYLHDANWRDGWTHVELLDLSEFGFEPIKDHYLTVDEDSSRESVYVTYFADEWAGAKNKRTSPTKLGRYLKQFYPQLTDDDVTTKSSEIFTKLVQVDLQLAYSADEIQAIYEESHGTNAGSCMSYPMTSGQWNHWQKDHPSRAYAGPDLAVAYIRKPLTGQLLGRALVWPDRKIYGSIYGDYDKMRAALSQAGYGKQDGFSGARMSRLVQRREGNRVYVACPYLDDTSCCYDNGEYLVMGRASGFETRDGGTSGYISITEYRCAVSDKVLRSGQAVEVLDPRAESVFVSRDLVEEHTDYAHGHRWLKTDNDDDYVTVAGGKRLQRGLVDAYYRRCYVTNELHPSDGGQATPQGWACNKVLFSEFVVCQVNRSWLRKKDAIWMEHGAYWSRLAFNAHGVTVDGKHYAKLLQQEAA